MFKKYIYFLSKRPSLVRSKTIANIYFALQNYISSSGSGRGSVGPAASHQPNDLRRSDWIHHRGRDRDWLRGPHF